jgi:peptide/nickel transport system permease protein
LAFLVVVYLDAWEVLNLGTANWLYPVSVVGTSMAMISLSLAGEGDKRDRILSILTSLIPIAVLSLPMILRLDAQHDPESFLQIFVVSAISFGLSGINLHKAYVDAYVLREKLRLTALRTLKVSKQALANRMFLVGIATLLFFVSMAVLAPILVTHADPNSWRWADAQKSYQEPSKEFLFGTDFYGKDVYSLTVYGSRASLIVGLAASLISIVLGTTIGLSAGYFGKISDEILMRFTDFFLVSPWFPLTIVIAMLMGKSFTNVIIVIGITSWPSTARIVRSQVFSVKEKAFVERARAIGSGSGHIISKHILPNVFPLIFANTILLIANSIFSESFLDFFGLGDPSVVSWGTMLEVAYEKGAFSSYAWWSILVPGACIVILIMSFYLIGDALDEILNPKLRRR